jgi:hypothetical protein
VIVAVLAVGHVEQAEVAVAITGQGVDLAHDAQVVAL